MSKIEQSAQEKRNLENVFNKYKSDAQADAIEMVAKLEQRKQMIEQLNYQLEEKDKKFQKNQDELFRKEN